MIVVAKYRLTIHIRLCRCLSSKTVSGVDNVAARRAEAPTFFTEFNYSVGKQMELRKCA